MLRRLDDLLNKREWIQLKREAESLLRLPDLDDYQLGRIYRALGRASIGLCQFSTSIQYFEVGLPYSTRVGDWDNAGYIQLDLGGAYLVLGNRKDARQYLEAYLMHLPSYTDARHFEGRAHFNLGLLYRQDKQYLLSIAAYKQALRCFLDRQALRDAADTHQNIAWLHLLLGNAKEARPHIQAAADFNEAPEDFATEQLILQGLLHCVLGDLTTSVEYLTPVLDDKVSVAESHRSSARWVAAQVRLQQGDRDEAKRLVQEALSIAISAKETHLVGLCLDLEDRIRAVTAGETAEPHGMTHPE